jgi:hypothetical protein
MKIHAEKSDAVLRQERLAQKSRSDGEGFEEALALELRQAETAARGVSPPPPGAQAGAVGRLLLETAQSPEPSIPLDETLRQSFQQTSGLLDSWGAYADALSASGAEEGGLKEVYPLLEGLEERMRGLKQSSAPLAGKHAGLESLIAELEVMTVTEKIKFNRGDYM